MEKLSNEEIRKKYALAEKRMSEISPRKRHAWPANSVMFFKKSPVKKSKWGNRIDVWRDVLTKENADVYFSKTIALYNKGDYEAALKGFKNLSEFVDSRFGIIVVPHIEKCKHVLGKRLFNSDKRHMKNQAILEYFRWIDWIKYLTGIASFVSCALFTGDPEEGRTFLDNFSERPWLFVLAIFLAFLTFLIHKCMKRFTVSDNLIRCKYCGRYTFYINPNEPTFGFMDNNDCGKCGRMYPVPDFYWDGWDGLEYINNRHSVPDGEFYQEYSQLKKKYSKEYGLYINGKNETKR